MDAELGPDGGLVIGWTLRGTLHLATREDYHWLLGLTAGVQEGVTAPDRAVAAVGRALADGPLDRDGIAERIGTRGQATHHVMVLAALREFGVRYDGVVVGMWSAKSVDAPGCDDELSDVRRFEGTSGR